MEITKSVNLGHYPNTIGNQNTATGWDALYNSTGNYNTANGANALYSNTTGSNNTANGWQTLYFNTTGSDNTALGYGAGLGGANHSQCTFIGSGSTLTTIRTNVTLLGYGILDAQCTGNNQVCIGNTAVTAIKGQVAFTTYSDARFKTNVREDVSGLDFILRLKPVTYNEKPRELHKIWRTPDSIVDNMDHSEIENMRIIGFLAQDVEKAAKESGFDFPGIDIPKNNKEVYSLRYSDFIMPLVKAVQELNTENESLKTTNQKLQAELSAVRSDHDARLKILEQILSTKAEK